MSLVRTYFRRPFADGWHTAVFICPTCRELALGHTAPFEVAIPSAMIAAMSPATKTSGMATDDLARPRALPAIRRQRPLPLGSRSVRGGPSPPVSLLKIANIEASRGSRDSRARSMPFSRD
jgi:hypothetical protein